MNFSKRLTTFKIIQMSLKSFLSQVQAWLKRNLQTMRQAWDHEALTGVLTTPRPKNRLLRPLVIFFTFGLILALVDLFTKISYDSLTDKRFTFSRWCMTDNYPICNVNVWAMPKFDSDCKKGSFAYIFFNLKESKTS